MSCLMGKWKVQTQRGESTEQKTKINNQKEGREEKPQQRKPKDKASNQRLHISQPSGAFVCHQNFGNKIVK